MFPHLFLNVPTAPSVTDFSHPNSVCLMPDLHSSNGESLDWVPLVFFTCLFNYCSFWCFRCNQISPMSLLYIPAAWLPHCWSSRRGIIWKDLRCHCRINTHKRGFCYICPRTWLFENSFVKMCIKTFISGYRNEMIDLYYYYILSPVYSRKMNQTFIQSCAICYLSGWRSNPAQF